MTHSIKNAFMTVTVSEKGAELQSILGADGTEYLWQGDPAYWNDRALNIFSKVSALKLLMTPIGRNPMLSGKKSVANV